MNGAKQATVWTTKYALTKGIQIRTGEITKDGYFYYRDHWGWSVQYAKGEWHHTAAEALAAAEQMRTRRIASLKKSIAKLEKLTFTAGEADSSSVG